MYYHISGFADSRNQIKTELRSVTKIVMNHLIKVFLYPNVQEQNHWKREIAQSLNDIAKQKGKNRFPTAKFLLQNTWEIYKDTLSTRLPVIIESIEETPINYDINNVYKAIHDYFNWLCDELSKTGIVRYNIIYSKIEELRSKYF